MMPPTARRAALVLLVAACSYDASGLDSAGATTTAGTSSSTGTTTTATSSTTGATVTDGTTSDATSTGTTTPVDPTTSTSTSTSTTEPATTGTSTSDTTSTTGTSTSTSTTDDTTGTSTTGDPPGLVDDGLIVRYYLDEAMSGQGPMEAVDSAPLPLHLPLVYSNTNGGNPVYAAQDGHLGLRWPATGLDGRATIPVMGTKVQQRLDGRVAATIEVVVDIDAVINTGSRISHIGAGSDPGHFSLRSANIQRLELYWKGGTLAGVWPVDLAAQGRAVVHVVFDTAQAAAADRLRLYLDGQPVAAGMDPNLVAPAQNEAITIPAANAMMQPLHYTLGNRGVDVDRSFQGFLFYAALYDAALSDADVMNNAAILAASDDTP